MTSFVHDTLLSVSNIESKSKSKADNKKENDGNGDKNNNIFLLRQIWLEVQKLCGQLSYRLYRVEQSEEGKE